MKPFGNLNTEYRRPFTRPQQQCVINCLGGVVGCALMATRTINASVYTYKRVVSEARKQLAMGSEIEALIEAAGNLRDLDPESPLVWALEERLRRASLISFMAIREKLATQAAAYTEATSTARRKS
jgi:hypothetical protein